jgi:hypothetical protein
MKERPILFSGPMVRAILEDRKTQTRRIVKPQPTPSIFDSSFSEWRPLKGVLYTDANMAWQPLHLGFEDWAERGFCKYGERGDQLWVKETSSMDSSDGTMIFRANGSDISASLEGKWTPSIFCTRAASRINLGIKRIRAERLNEISEADAMAEGVTLCEAEYAAGITAKGAYRTLWESINGAGSWAKNPWVWVIEFKQL